MTPNFVAKPDRGLSCASYPGGTAIAKPQEIKALPPGSIRSVDLTAALTSIPAAPMDSYTGSAISSQPDTRLIGTETCDLKAVFYPIRSAGPKTAGIRAARARLPFPIVIPGSKKSGTVLTLGVWSISGRNTSDWLNEPQFLFSALDPPIADASLTSSSSGNDRRVSDSGKC